MSLMKTRQAENSRLGFMSLVTSIGDWLTYFALMKLAYESSGSVLVASLSMSMKSLAIAFGAWVLPWTVSRFGTKSLMTVAQVSSGLILGSLTVALINGISVSVVAVYVFSFVLMALKQLFDAAREVHSKSLFDESANHRSNQAELLRAIFAAQLLGPILAFLLLIRFPIWVPIALDSTSFLLTAVIGLTLRHSYKSATLAGFGSALKVFEYFKRKPKLKSITLLRSFGFWIPNAFFNMVLFTVAVKQFGKGIESTAILYTAIGLGAAFTSHSLKSGWLGLTRFNVRKHADGRLAMFAQFGYAIATLGLLMASSPVYAVLTSLGAGLVMGINSVATQSIRRTLSTTDELSNVISFELILGRVVEALSVGAFGLLAGKFGISQDWILLLASCLFLASAVKHRKFG